MIRFRVDLSARCSIGPGKIELLESIAQTGSLTKAARQQGLSYRHAWLLLDDLNRSFAERVTIARVGGNHRGSVTLTAVGREIIRCYRSAALAIESAARAQLRPIAAKALMRGSAGSSAPRKRVARRPLLAERI